MLTLGLLLGEWIKEKGFELDIYRAKNINDVWWVDVRGLDKKNRDRSLLAVTNTYVMTMRTEEPEYFRPEDPEFFPKLEKFISGAIKLRTTTS